MMTIRWFGFACIRKTEDYLNMNANLNPSKLQQNFDNRHGGANVGHDEKSLRAERARFDSEHLFQNLVLSLLTNHCG